MIVLSLALVVASVGTLVGGLAASSAPLVWSSLAAGLAAVALIAGSVARRRTHLAAEPSPLSPAARDAGGGSSRTPAVTGTPLEVPNAGGVFPGDRPSAPPPLPADTPPVVPIAQSDRSGAAGTVVNPGTVGAPFGDTPSDGDTPQSKIGPSGAAPLPQDADRTAQLSEPTADPPAEPLGGPGEPAVEVVPVGDALRVAQLDDPVTVRDGHPRYHLADCPTLPDGPGVSSLPVSVARRSGFTPCAVCAPDRALLATSRHRR